MAHSPFLHAGDLTVLAVCPETRRSLPALYPALYGPSLCIIARATGLRQNEWSALKYRAHKESVSVLVLVELTHASSRRRDRPPGLPDLRDYGTLEYEAGTVLFKHCSIPSPYLHIAKNRYGTTGAIDERVLFRGVTAS